MPGFNPENINIHDLTIEEPEKQAELPFDPERDLTENDWINMKKLLDGPFEKKDWHHFLSDAADMKLLDATMSPDIDEKSWKEIERALRRTASSGSFSEFVADVKNAKILNPDFNLNLGREDWRGIEKTWDDNGAWPSPYYLVGVKIIDPTNDLKLTEKDWQYLEKKLKESIRQNQWESFAHLAANMKILNPDYDFHLNETAWSNMAKKLEDFRNDNYYWTFASYAKDMKILAAEKVKITSKGLEITMPHNKLTKVGTPEAPEQRKF